MITTPIPPEMSTIAMTAYNVLTLARAGGLTPAEVCEQSAQLGHTYPPHRVDEALTCLRVRGWARRQDGQWFACGPPGVLVTRRDRSRFGFDGWRLSTGELLEERLQP